MLRRGGGRHPVAAGRAARTIVAHGFTAGLALFSVLAAHDYLAWNRARWTALAEIERDRRGDARTVDGGFEYDGLYNYDPGYVADPAKSWWWVDGDALLLSFAPLPGTETLRTYPYAAYLPMGTRAIYLVARAGPGPASAGAPP